VAALSERSAGFTLIELLLVVALVGIAAGVVAMSVHGDERRKVQEEGDRLSALFRMAQSEARISGRTLLWEADLSGYWFRTAAAADNDTLRDELQRKRPWPFEVRRVDTRQIVFTREPLREPALIEIDTRDREVRLALDALGNLRPLDCEREACAGSR
jgi:general secretion pathway protein H